MEKIRLHIVDDRIEFIESLKHLFRNDESVEFTGYNLNPEEFIETVNPKNFDILLVDIKMPGMNGVEMIKRIVGDYPFIKVIVLSVYYDRERLFDVVGAGAMGYVTKNSSKKELLKAFDTVMQGEKYFKNAVSRLQ